LRRLNYILQKGHYMFVTVTNDQLILRGYNTAAQSSQFGNVYVRLHVYVCVYVCILRNTLR